MGKVTGGELVVRTLVKANVTNIFGLHGAHLETIFQSCLDHHIPITDTRHEVAAGHAAEGYARATRTLGVAMATAGPGFTNIITSIANAYLDRTPVLYISLGTRRPTRCNPGSTSLPLRRRSRSGRTGSPFRSRFRASSRKQCGWLLPHP